MFFYDPFYMIVMVIGGLLVFLPQMWVQNTYKKYSEVPSANGLTGAEVATAILRDHGIHDVKVEPVAGMLSDHYDPMHKVVRLSEENYYGRSIAGVAVAAHEVGHAIQHHTSFFPMSVRSSLAPVAGLGSNLGPWLFMIALFMGATSHAMPGWAWSLAWIGIAIYGLAVMFHIVTLPVELDASSRALVVLSTGSRYLSTREMEGAKKVLTAAAFTYVAAALYSLMQLLYFVFRLLGSRRDD